MSTQREVEFLSQGVKSRGDLEFPDKQLAVAGSLAAEFAANVLGGAA